MAIILGIDPGSRVTGYGVIRQVGRQLSYLGSGCIRTKVDDLPSRLKLIYAGVTEIITQFQPDYFAIEQVFMAKNADSALKLGQARGVAIVAATNQALPVFGIRRPSGQADRCRDWQRRKEPGPAYGCAPCSSCPPIRRRMRRMRWRSPSPIAMSARMPLRSARPGSIWRGGAYDNRKSGLDIYPAFFMIPPDT